MVFKTKTFFSYVACKIDEKKEFTEVLKIANALYEKCKDEISELKICGDCYIKQGKEDEFTSVCSEPHLLLWVKFHTYPYWPAKLKKDNNGLLEVYFFKDHTKATVTYANCLLYSKEDPNTYCTDTYKADIQNAMHVIRKIFKAFLKIS